MVRKPPPKPTAPLPKCFCCGLPCDTATGQFIASKPTCLGGRVCAKCDDKFLRRQPPLWEEIEEPEEEYAHPLRTKLLFLIDEFLYGFPTHGPTRQQVEEFVEQVRQQVLVYGDG